MRFEAPDEIGPIAAKDRPTQFSTLVDHPI